MSYRNEYQELYHHVRALQARRDHLMKLSKEGRATSYDKALIPALTKSIELLEREIETIKGDYLKQQ